MNRAYVTITTSGKKGRLFLGVTSNPCFSAGRHKLVWYEEYPGKPQAARREADIKRWARGCKIALIEKLNPSWTDLSAG